MESIVEAVNVVWSSCLMTLVALIFLWRIVGWSLLSGLVTFVVMIPIEFFVASKITSLQGELMKMKDIRMKSVNEALQVIFLNPL